MVPRGVPQAAAVMPAEKHTHVELSGSRGTKFSRSLLLLICHHGTSMPLLSHVPLFETITHPPVFRRATGRIPFCRSNGQGEPPDIFLWPARSQSQKLHNPVTSWRRTTAVLVGACAQSGCGFALDSAMPRHRTVLAPQSLAAQANRSRSRLTSRRRPVPPRAAARAVPPAAQTTAAGPARQTRQYGPLAL